MLRMVKDLVAGSGISLETHGTHRLKGVPEEWQLMGASTPPINRLYVWRPRNSLLACSRRRAAC